MLVLLKNNLNYFKDSILECFFKEHNRLLFFFKNIPFFTTYNDGKSWQKNLIKDIKIFLD